jgi:HAD superfamily hydrolase (TIGR01484 family)
MDGTLCESRQKATSEMLIHLKALNEKKKVFIVSGAELARMELQCPMKYVTYFSQNGNIIYDGDKEIRHNELTNKEEILKHIDLLRADYPIAEVEDRGSQITVSFTGFTAPQEIKNSFDPDRKIRLEMLKRYPFHNAFVAGLTGIDYIPKTKGENIQHYLELRKIKPADCIYIGDALEKGANDETVVGVIPTFAVKNPEDTLKFIKQL